jgi:dihydrofolate reductase
MFAMSKRKIITTTFVTMDGVMQAPGAPEEDPSSGFTHGGWQAKVMDKSLRDAIDEFLRPPFAMLLGRHTYDIFAGHWPKQDPNNAIAKQFNEATKYVVSHEPFEADWVNTTVVSGDVPAALRRLKAEAGPDLIVWGSGTLIQTLLRETLVDRMHIWIHPVTVGTGKRLFADGTPPAAWKLVKSRVGDAVIIATYEPAGELVTGTIGA